MDGIYPPKMNGPTQYINDQKGPYTKREYSWEKLGKHLKSTTYWNNSGNGTDDFGFSGLPGGWQGAGVFSPWI